MRKHRTRVSKRDNGRNLILQHLQSGPSNTVVLSGSASRQLAALYTCGQYLAQKVSPKDVRALHAQGFIALDPAKSNTTERQHQWQTFRALTEQELDELEKQMFKEVRCATCDHREHVGGEISEKTLEDEGWELGPTQALCPDHNDQSGN